MINISSLQHRVEIWGNSPVQNELGESDYVPIKIKTIWASIIPQTGSMQRGQADTILSSVTTKFICRYLSGKDITYDMWLVYKGKRHDIKYILNPYESNETLEIFCEEVIE